MLNCIRDKQKSNKLFVVSPQINLWDHGQCVEQKINVTQEEQRLKNPLILKKCMQQVCCECYTRGFRKIFWLGGAWFFLGGAKKSNIRNIPQLQRVKVSLKLQENFTQKFDFVDNFLKFFFTFFYKFFQKKVNFELIFNNLLEISTIEKILTNQKHNKIVQITILLLRRVVTTVKLSVATFG
eukprot:TRINITY_DN1643_c0_g4_i1.p2 TRINITY_DN1643_c0_g4~~TRINITY_DN1643_c0_g4_i1.p2  ORF type:complete len:182 (+),score=14.36 TRINITY_DN1643_c0_g4_i1:603-1148(+)